MGVDPEQNAASDSAPFINPAAMSRGKARSVKMKLGKIPTADFVCG
jgi:hypothetical protein